MDVDEKSRDASDNRHNSGLGNLGQFEETVHWVRNQIVLGENREGIVELNLALPPSAGKQSGNSATVFLRREDTYLVGFRGKDGVYLLDETGSPKKWEQELRESNLLQRDERVTIAEGVGASHRALRSFERTFLPYEIAAAGVLSGVSAAQLAADQDSVRAAISTLVFMISESARSQMVEYEFAQLYFGNPVKADKAVQSYDHAKFLTRCANIFPDHRIALRIERLDKRASEVRALHGLALSSVPNTPANLGGFVAAVLSEPASESTWPQADRVKHIARELGVGHPDPERRLTVDQFTNLLDLCKDKAHIRAAERGVIVPPLRPPPPPYRKH